VCVLECGLRHPVGVLSRGLFGLMDPQGVSGLSGVVSPELSYCWLDALFRECPRAICFQEKLEIDFRAKLYKGLLMVQMHEEHNAYKC
jgi:hypothetical protein